MIQQSRTDKNIAYFMKFNLRFSLTWQHQISSKMCRVCHFLVTTSNRGSNQGLLHPPQHLSPSVLISTGGSLGTGLLLSSLPPSLPSYGDILPTTYNEKWVSTLFMLWGIVLFGCILGGLTSIITNSDAQRSKYIHHRDNLVRNDVIL